jgi:hypothetical protein
LSGRLKLEYVPIEKLKKWVDNPRVMPDDQAKALVRRWMNLTGKQAVLESTGQTFDEVQATRNGKETS